MAQLADAQKEIDKFERLAGRDTWVNRFHPLSKLLLGVFYIAFVVSFDKYNLSGLLAMAVYPFFVFNAGDLSLRAALHRLRIILPIVMIVGVFNPLFDREVAFYIGTVPVTGGVLSMVSLMIKGILTVLAAYLLIATTSIEEICYAFQCLHFPKTLIVIILLIYRYISLLLTEASKVTTAYRLRAPGQKGIHYTVWGPLVGQMLLRSMDRAQAVYDAMSLRGFRGEFVLRKKAGRRVADVFYLAIWVAVFAIIRNTDVITWIGGLFVA